MNILFRRLATTSKSSSTSPVFSSLSRLSLGAAGALGCLAAAASAGISECAPKDPDCQPPPSYEDAMSASRKRKGTPSPIKDIDSKAVAACVENAVQKALAESPVIRAELRRAAEQAVRDALASPRVKRSIDSRTQVYLSQVSKDAEQAAATAVAKQMFAVEGKLDKVVARNIKEQLPIALMKKIDRDPMIESILHKHILQTRRAVLSVVDEVIKEEKYQHVNRAFLRRLDEHARQQLRRMEKESIERQEQQSRGAWKWNTLSVIGFTAGMAALLKSKL